MAGGPLKCSFLSRRESLVGPPLNSAFLVTRGGLVGGTTKLSLLVKKAGISGGPTILKCMYMWILEKSKCPHKCMLHVIVLLCKVP